MSLQQQSYTEGLFKHVDEHPLHSVFSLHARGTSCCTLLPQRHTTVTHPALHPVLTKHSVTVSETSLSTFASSFVLKKTNKKKPVSATVRSVITRHKIERLQRHIDFYGHIWYIKGPWRWYSVTNSRIHSDLFLSCLKRIYDTDSFGYKVTKINLSESNNQVK